MKFRAWDSFNEEYIYSDKIKAKGNVKNKYWTLADFFELVAELEHAGNNPIVEKGPGSKDKYDKELYQGNIVKVKHKDGNYDIGPIQYRETTLCFAVYLKNTGPGITVPLLNYMSNTMCCGGPEIDIEIIGNIHENPELLEEKN